MKSKPEKIMQISWCSLRRIVLSMLVITSLAVIAIPAHAETVNKTSEVVDFKEAFQRRQQQQANQETGGFEAGLKAAEAGDFGKAHRLWLKEAELGHVRAQSYLGVLYAQGQGVKQDGAEAAKWFRLAAEQGDVTAQTNLGALYAKGQGVVQDDRQAAKWFHKAAEQGDTNAKSYLGILYARGRGVQQNDKVSARWFQLAAREGDAKAQYSLAVLYDVGRGVKQNKIVAYAWYALAAEQGDPAARNALGNIESALNPDEIVMSAQIAEQLRTQITP